MNKKFTVIKYSNKSSVETLSENILTSIGVNSFLGNKTSLDKDKSTPSTTMIALRHYFSQILDQPVEAKQLRNPTYPLELNQISFVKDPRLHFFRSLEKKKIILGAKFYQDFFDTLGYSLGRDITVDEKTKINKDLLIKYSQEYINNILIQSIVPELIVPEVVERDYTIPKPIYHTFIIFYKDLIAILSSVLNVNIIWYFPVINRLDSIIKDVYLYNYIEGLPLIGLRIVIHFLSKIPRDTIKKEEVNQISYENLVELDTNTNSINRQFSEPIINQIKGNLSINILSLLDTLKIGDQLVFNPLDKEGELKVIQIQVSPLIKKTYLLGKSGNLYEDDGDEDDGGVNDLVGNLVFINKTTYDSKVYWCKGYLGKITGN